MKARSGPNWLLRVLIGASLLVHVLIIFHISKGFGNHTLSYIELSIVQFSKPDTPHIPTPVNRPKNKVVAVARAIRPKTFTVPKIKIGPVRADRMDPSYEKIGKPDLPAKVNYDDLAVAGISPVSSIAAATPQTMPQTTPLKEDVAYTNVQAYINMLKLRIDAAKQYPEPARLRHLEGRVKVRFILLASGALTNIKVVKSSQYKNLDDAAVKAVKKSSPCPKPPPSIFDPPVILEVDILFELT